MDVVNDMGKPIIVYPVEWPYKIIGTDLSKIETAVEEIVNDRSFVLNKSNQSAKGKYISCNVIITVNTEDEKNSFFTKLSSHKDIKIVL